jgi:hypothetical protein
MHALYTVATAALATADQRVIALLTRYFDHEDEIVLRTARIAANISGWPEFERQP